MIRVEDEEDVFHRDDERQRPKGQRNHPNHVGRLDRYVSVTKEDFIDRVKDRRADIAVDDTCGQERREDCPVDMAFLRISVVQGDSSFPLRRPDKNLDHRFRHRPFSSDRFADTPSTSVTNRCARSKVTMTQVSLARPTHSF